VLLLLVVLSAGFDDDEVLATHSTKLRALENKAGECRILNVDFRNAAAGSRREQISDFAISRENAIRQLPDYGY
jgi:hypothetical protein